MQTREMSCYVLEDNAFQMLAEISLWAFSFMYSYNDNQVKELTFEASTSCQVQIACSHRLINVDVTLSICQYSY